MQLLRKVFAYPEVWVLTLVAFVTRLWALGAPSDIVFDEVYFRQFAANYLQGEYFFDIHPPLVKLLFAGVGVVFGLSPSDVAEGAAGTEILRLMPAIAGAALVPLMYVVVRQLGLGRRIAILGALLVLCDNALLVESRFVLMDSLLLLFGLFAISCFLQFRRSSGRQRILWLVATSLAVGMLVSTKWTGLAVAGLLAGVWMYEFFVRKGRKQWKLFVPEFVVAVFIICGVYMSAFAVHFSLLPMTGEGDVFMSERFQSTLQGSIYASSDSAPMSFWDKFMELNTQMYTAQSSLTSVSHPYASRWYTWPFEVRPIYYWQGKMSESGAQGNIYLLGNPVVWWLSSVTVISTLIVLYIRPKLLQKKRRAISFVLLGYVCNFLPFVFIERPMFLYHYFFALLFGIILTCIMAAIVYDHLYRIYGRNIANSAYILLVGLVVAGFIYFIPISYGIAMSMDEMQRYMWLPTWR